MVFAQQYVDCSMEQWSSVLFSAECRFRLPRSDDGRLRVWGRTGARHREGLIQMAEIGFRSSGQVWKRI